MRGLLGEQARRVDGGVYSVLGEVRDFEGVFILAWEASKRERGFSRAFFLCLRESLLGKGGDEKFLFLG